MFKGLFDFKNQKINIKWELISPIIFFVSVSLFILSSTSDSALFLKSTFYKQFLWVFLGSIIFTSIQFVRLQYFYDYSYLLYIFLFIFLLSTIFSIKIHGAKSWIILGPFYFQPSEFGKIIYVICIARFFTDFKDKNKISIHLIFVLLILMFPPFIVFTQPDLGTAIIYLSVIIPMLYWSGINSLIIFLLISPFISMIAVSNFTFFYIWMILYIMILFYLRSEIFISIVNFLINLICGLFSQYAWINILQEHHRDRVNTFLDPFSDPFDKGYQVIQSIISIGSGGLWGKGWGNGTQTHLKFLPVRDTDFIISVVSEEMGFFSILIIMLSLCWLIYWVLDYAQRV